MMFIIFDTETTGLPLDWNAPMSNLNNWPRVIQISWQVRDIDFNLISTHTYLIQPDNWHMKDLPYWENLGYTKEQVLLDKGKRFWTENGFTNEQNKKEGLPMQEVLKMFTEDYDKCVYMVAHNIDYDFPVLGAEFLRYGMSTNKKLFKLCTMKSTTNFVQIPGYKPGTYKWPTLMELHKRLFSKGFDGAHDASADVTACADCLKELLIKRIMLLPMYVNNELRPVRYKDLKDEVELHKLREQNRKAEETKRVDYSNNENLKNE